MTIYVDVLVDRGWRFGPNCHMATDDLSEAGLHALHLFALAIGLHRSDFQPKSFPHYDLTGKLRERAIACGAVAVTQREMVGMIRQARKQVTS